MALASLLAACNESGSSESPRDALLDLTLEPSPPIVGASVIRLDIHDPDGVPLRGARVRIEGNMNHAGMVPEFADATEVQPGRYEAELEFTMGGDWFLLIGAEIADGSRLEWRKDVPGVRSR